MSAATWRAWLDRVAASHLSQDSTLQSWTHAVQALERCQDAAARQLIERLLAQGAAVWQVAEDMCGAGEAAASASENEHRPTGSSPSDSSPSGSSPSGSSPSGSSVVFAQLFLAAASDERSGVPVATAGLAATLSGVALGALAAQAGSAPPCPAAGAGTGGIDQQLRRLSSAIEAGYEAHADSTAFANEVAAAFNAWLASEVVPSTAPARHGVPRPDEV